MKITNINDLAYGFISGEISCECPYIEEMKEKVLKKEISFSDFRDWLKKNLSDVV